MSEVNSRTLPSTIIEIRRGGAKTPIYFPPGVDGKVEIDPAFKEALPADVPLYELRNPVDRHRLAESIQSMASALCADLMAFQPQGPFALAGYSFGGLLAYEMARQLKAAGREVRLLVIFDTGPDLSSRGGVPAATRVWRCLQNLPMYVYEDLICSLGKETPARLWRSVKNHARRGLWKRRGNAPLIAPKAEHLFDIREWSEDLYAHVDNNLKLIAAVKYLPYDGEVVLFRARARPLLLAHSWDLGWQTLTRSVKVIRTPGNHHTLMISPYIRRVAQSLREVVEAAG